MNLIAQSLGDPIWQIGGGIILLAALVLLLALRSPEIHLSPWHQWLWTRILLLVCFSLFLVLSAGVVLSHGANAASTAVPAGSQPSSATASPHSDSSPSPTPFPGSPPGPHRYSPRSAMPSSSKVETTGAERGWLGSFWLLHHPLYYTPSSEAGQSQQSARGSVSGRGRLWEEEATSRSSLTAV